MTGQRHAPAAVYPRKVLVPTVQEAGWAPGPVWTGAENISPTGIRSPDRPARSQSLYRLSYPAHGIPGATFQVLPNRCNVMCVCVCVCVCACVCVWCEHNSS